MNNLLAFLLALTIMGVCGDICPSADNSAVTTAQKFLAVVDDTAVLPTLPEGVLGTQGAALPWAPAEPLVGIEVGLVLIGEVGCPTGCAGPVGSTDRQWRKSLRIRDPPA